jgi:streptogramin lyase
MTATALTTAPIRPAPDLAIGAPFDLKPGPGRTLWFTNRSTPTIGRVRFG